MNIKTSNESELVLTKIKLLAKVRYGTGGMITMGFNGNKCLFHENIIVRHDKQEIIVPEAFPVDKTPDKIMEILND